MKFYDVIDKDYLEEIIIDMAHHSTAIEGNTLTMDETRTILKENCVDIKRKVALRDIYEVSNYKNIIYYLHKEYPFDVETIKLFHRILTNNTLYNSGHFKTEENTIGGKLTTHPSRVKQEMYHWVDNAMYRLNIAKSDDEIYTLIKFNNKNKLQLVKNRIKNFKYFMENLEKAVLYENTSKTTSLKSDFLLIEIENDKYLQLSIARDRLDIDYLETFIVDNKNRYIDGSSISENVVSIERYKEDKLIPFSFDAIKNKKLLDAYTQNKDFNYQDCILKKELNNELQNCNKQYEYYRDKLLTFNKKD